jgi:signal transduction histidine kinase/ligand-binding sensor protein
MGESRFEKAIGDKEVLRIMLEGALKDWGGSFDVWLSDTQEYLFNSIDHANFRPFCRKLREHREGERRCQACDESFAQRMKNDPHTPDNVYTCHIGLRDTAVPIVVEGEHLATVFFGQAQPEEKEAQVLYRRQVRTMEDKLGLQLQVLAAEVPVKTASDFAAARDRVSKIVTYIAEMGSKTQHLQEVENQNQRYQQSTEALKLAATELAELSTDFGSFWESVTRVLDVVGSATAAGCSMVALADMPNKKLRIRAVSGLPYGSLKDQPYDFYDKKFEQVLESNEVISAEIDMELKPNTFSQTILHVKPDLYEQLKGGILSRINLGNDRRGILLMFVTTPLSETSYIEHMKGYAAQLAILIGVAHQASTTYLATAKELKQRVEWTEQVTHQILSPLNAVRGHAENASRRMEKWKSEYGDKLYDVLPPREIKRWEDRLDEIMATGYYAARLARNLGWVNFQKHDNYALTVCSDLRGILISCARNFQSLAKARGINRLSVNENYNDYAQINGQICLDENQDLFRQSIENLLDNAVKYGYPKTDIVIDTKTDGKYCDIRVINIGIRITERYKERIFDYGFRTDDAKYTNAPGTGIGLYVAREIIKQHKGTLTLENCVRLDEKYWKTTFLIRLPLSARCQ